MQHARILRSLLSTDDLITRIRIYSTRILYLSSVPTKTDSRCQELVTFDEGCSEGPVNCSVRKKQAVLVAIVKNASGPGTIDTVLPYDQLGGAGRVYQLENGSCIAAQKLL